MRPVISGLPLAKGAFQWSLEPYERFFSIFRVRLSLELSRANICGRVLGLATDMLTASRTRQSQWNSVLVYNIMSSIREP